MSFIIFPVEFNHTAYAGAVSPLIGEKNHCDYIPDCIFPTDILYGGCYSMVFCQSKNTGAKTLCQQKKTCITMQWQMFSEQKN